VKTEAVVTEASEGKVKTEAMPNLSQEPMMVERVARAIRAAIDASKHLAAFRDVGEEYHGEQGVTMLYVDGAFDLSAVATAAIGAILSTGDDAGLVELSGYTPGPWRVELDRRIVADRWQVAQVDALGGPWPKSQTWHEREANARLIAKAPELHALSLSLTARNKALEEALRDAGDDMDFACTAIQHLKEHKARVRLEQTLRKLAALNHQDNRQKEGGE
jgi:hypothetical protein